MFWVKLTVEALLNLLVILKWKVSDRGVAAHLVLDNGIGGANSTKSTS